MNKFRTRPPIVPCLVGAVAGALGLILLMGVGPRVFAVLLLLFAGWVVVSSMVQSMVRISEEGVSFMTLRGRQQWLWTEITEAHPSGTGTVPGIAVYRGSEFLGLESRSFRNWQPSLDTLKHAFLRAPFAVLGRPANPPLEPTASVSLGELDQ